MDGGIGGGHGIKLSPQGPCTRSWDFWGLWTCAMKSRIVKCTFKQTNAAIKCRLFEN